MKFRLKKFIIIGIFFASFVCILGINPAIAEIDTQNKIILSEIFEKFGLFNIFIIFLVTLGPIKLIAPFVRLTKNADLTLRRQLALRSFSISTLIILGVALICKNTLNLWQIDISAMIITTGIILFIVAIKTVLGQYQSSPTTQTNTVDISMNSIIHPLVFPHILTPYGISIVVTISAILGQMEISPIPLLLLLLLVMSLNLIIMLAAYPILNFIKPITLKILGFVFGVMQVALGLDMILTGIKMEILIFNSL